MDELIEDMQAADKQPVVEQADNKYSSEVALDLTIKSGDKIEDASHPHKIMVHYEIEIEYRSWGIKGVELYVTEPVTIEYETDSGESKSITIEPDRIEVGWEPGAHVAPYQLEVWLEGDKLKEATLFVSFIDKG